MYSKSLDYFTSTDALRLHADLQDKIMHESKCVSQKPKNATSQIIGLPTPAAFKEKKWDSFQMWKICPILSKISDTDTYE